MFFHPVSNFWQLIALLIFVSSVLLQSTFPHHILQGTTVYIDISEQSIFMILGLVGLES